MGVLFAKRLKELRAETGLTQRAIASQLGISQASYYSWEMGKTEPSIDSILILCDIFDISADYLIGRVDESGAPIHINNSFNGATIGDNFNIGHNQRNRQTKK